MQAYFPTYVAPRGFILVDFIFCPTINPRVQQPYRLRSASTICALALYSHLILQLSQVLKYEAHADSALSRFLLRRALAAPRPLGHALYW